MILHRLPRIAGTLCLVSIDCCDPLRHHMTVHTAEQSVTEGQSAACRSHDWSIHAYAGYRSTSDERQLMEYYATLISVGSTTSTTILCSAVQFTASTRPRSFTYPAAVTVLTPSRLSSEAQLHQMRSSAPSLYNPHEKYTISHNNHLKLDATTQRTRL